MGSKSIKRVILTGAPSTGKTAVLEQIKNLGFSSYPEIARQVIKDSLNQNSNVVPWLKLLDFSEVVAQKQLQQHNLAQNGWSFFDRGLPDVIAYLQKGNTQTTSAINAYLKQVNYHTTVFLFPIWEEIYFNDQERIEPLKDALLIQEHLIKTYTNLNYNIVIVPKLAVMDRCNFILKTLRID